ncbi:MAG TPA: hypothetical protein VH394_04540 [Thermoanaerobaculia bacterium]|jgi:molybdopterin converting factor small subunit|nr:hypothetical protein [Thermoanaerobaculia bacterium]
MRKDALAATLLAWMKLIASGREHLEEVPTIGPLLDALEERLERAKALDLERARLRAEQQRLTRELRETRAEGDELMTRVRNLLRSVFGRESVRLVAHAMRPRPQRYRSAGSEDGAE